VWLDHILSIHPAFGGHLGCLHSLAVVNGAAMNVHEQVFAESLLSVLLGTHLRVERLGHREILCVTFGGTAKLFATGAEPFRFPPRVYENPCQRDTKVLTKSNLFFLWLPCFLVSFNKSFPIQGLVFPSKSLHGFSC